MLAKAMLKQGIFVVAHQQDIYHDCKGILASIYFGRFNWDVDAPTVTHSGLP